LLLAGLSASFASVGCGGQPSPVELQPVEALRLGFPDQAPRVLRGSEALVAAGDGFALALTADPVEATGRRGGLSAALPKRGEDAIRFHLLGGFDLRVHEHGASGDGLLADGAVVYPRHDGSSFWSATEEGYEEWLLLQAGIATGQAPVAVWEVEGAQLRQTDGAVEIADDSGTAQVRVTAPAAFASGGRRVAARLAVRGSQIELWVDAGGEPVLVDPVWAPAASMTGSRYFHTAVTLNGGKVLVTGGYRTSAAVATAEIYDPATMLWTPTGAMNVARYIHTATLLPDGKVLVAGGGTGAAVVNSAEIYDPATALWTLTGSMTVPRNAHTAILLSTGKVLVAGGGNGSSANLTAELYNPSTKLWTSTGSMTGARYFHTATLLSSGKVLVAGGFGTAALASAEIYDPVATTWSAAHGMNSPRYYHTATLLSSGKVLVVAGLYSGGPLASAEVYDATANTWTTGGAMIAARYVHSATLLASGKVLVAGGYNSTSLASAEVFDPSTTSWSSAGSMITPRYEHTATLLTATGKVLIVGGYNSSTPFASAELFDPLANTWASAGTMTSARYAHTATLLPSGNVLVLGGISGSYLTNSDLYNPITKAWTSVPAMSTPRGYHTATLLATGKVLVLGGYNATGPLATGALYDPQTNLWIAAPPAMNVARWVHATVLLNDGRVLVVGGYGVSAATSAAIYVATSNSWQSAPAQMGTDRYFHTATLLKTGSVLVTGGITSASTFPGASVYAPGANTWTATGLMGATRSSHASTLLVNGKVLVTGGHNASPGQLASAELYDPGTNGWSAASSMTGARFDHSAMLLGNGLVLVAGGTGATTLSSAELFNPVANSWVAAPSMLAARSTHLATLLGGGNVLVTGGSDSAGALATAESYTPVAIDDANPCTTDAWNVSLGQVTHVLLAAGASCADADLCNGSETCSAAGVCQAGTAIVVTDNNPCTTDACAPATGVVSHALVAAGTSCSDGNLCNGAETCSAGGACQPGTAVVTNDNNACTTDGCVPATGQVTHVAVVAGTSCSDGNTCNGAELCDAVGTCAPGTLQAAGTTCSDGNPCNGVELCNGAGACSPGLTAPSGTVCADGNACNGVETCDGLGVCKAGTALAVGSTCGGGICSLSTCSAAHVCVQGPLALNGTSCDQGSTCTAAATCLNGQCSAIGNNGASCSDGDACNGLETCLNGLCVAGTPLAVDADPCTSDVCNPLTGAVTHTTCAGIDPTAPTDIVAANATLLAGTTVDPSRAAVLRGIVTRNDVQPVLQPLPNVKISIVGAPSSGTVLTQLDGHFDIAVNGGGQVRVRYEKAGYLTVERSIEAVWKEYAWLPDVTMTPLDPTPSDITLDDVGMQTARGGLVQDADGVRQATVLVPAHTAAIKIKNGVSTPLTGALTVRATEFTVGPNGPTAMPGPLPPTTAYTYCVELTADEALDADSIQFVQAQNTSVPQSMPLYLENFINFPVGTTVPMGYYDRKLGEWMPSANGRIVQILDIVNGSAVLATTTSGGVPVHDAADETALGVTPDELVKLKQFYVKGQTLWRVPISHFTPYDGNWPYGPPPDKCDPSDASCQPDDPGGGGGPGGGAPVPDDPCKSSGSIIECQSQMLGEAIPVAGSPYALHYSSGRVPGRRDAYRLSIPLVKALPASVQRIDLTIQVAGQRIQQSVTCPCNNLAPYQFVWDGKDGYGRAVEGAQPVVVDVAYVYNAIYLAPAAFAQAFGGTPSSSSMITYVANRANNQVSTVKRWRGLVGPWDQRGAGLGGWSLDVQHVYDPASRMLYLGNGDRRSTSGIRPALTTVLGSGSYNNGNPLLDCLTPPSTCLTSNVYVGKPQGVVGKPDGTVIFTDATVGRIRQVGPSGVVTTLAQLPQLPNSLPNALALAPDGSVFFSTFSSTSTTGYQVLRLDTLGNVTPFAGAGTQCTPATAACGDDSTALGSQLGFVSALAVGPDGSVYVAAGLRVRRVAPDGTIHAFAGTGAGGGTPLDDGQLANQVGLGGLPVGLLAAPDGNLYISVSSAGSANFIRFVTPSGKIGTIAGANSGSTADGAAARSTVLTLPGALAMGSNRYLVFQDYDRVRQIGANNVVTTIAGNPPPECTSGNSTHFCGEGAPAAASNVGAVTGLGFAPDGSLLIASSNIARVMRVSSPLPRYGVGNIVIPSEDGSEVFVFDQSGRHLETRDGLTNGLKYQFNYETALGGRLVSIVSTAGTNHITTVEYTDATHRKITGPFGDETQLVLDVDHNLTSLSRKGGTTLNPVTETYTLQSTVDGLLTSFSDPVGTVMGYAHTLAYDVNGAQSTGRLLSDSAPADLASYPVGANQSLALSISIDPATNLNDYLVTRTTKQDVGTYTTTYDVKRDNAGVETRTNTLPGVTNKAVTTIMVDGSRTITHPDGTVVKSTLVADPRFGLLAPTTSETTTLPVGPLTRTTVVNRALDSVTQVLDQTSAVNGNTSHSSYDPGQHTVVITTPGGRTSTVQLDSQGRLIGVVIPGMGTASIGYTADFGAVSVATRSATNELTRVKTPATYPVGSALGFTGRLHTVTDANGDVTSFDRYDRFGRVLLETLSGNRAVGMAYDRNGNVTELDPPAITPSYNAGTTLSAQHVFTFSSVNQLGSYGVRDAAIPGTVLEPTSYAYTPDKLLKTINRPEGDAVAVASSNGRADGTTLPTGEVVHSTFDPATGNLQSISGPTSGESVGFLYNGNMLTDSTWSGAVAGSVHRDYDNYFRGIADIAAGSPAYFGYDADGLVNCINTTQAASCQSGEVIAYKPGTVLLDGTTFPSSSATPIVDSYSDNGFGEPTSYLAQRGAQLLYETSMSRDSLGRIASKTEQILNADTSVTAHDYVYTYANRRLTDVLVDGAITSHYDYDANGNRLRRAVTNQGVLSSQDLGTYNVQDQLGSYGTRSFTYTPSGRLRTATDGADGATYTYDALGNLNQVVLTGSQNKTIVYILDGRGRRVGKKVNNHLLQAWLYQDELRIAAEIDYDALGNVTSTKRFVYGSKPNVPDLMIQSGTRYRILSDERGSPRMVISELGQIVARTDYDEFGQVLATSTNLGLQPFGFAGGLYDVDTKLVRFGARDYDAGSGRWTGKDSIRFRGGSTNLYGYVFGDPINYQDPNGLYGVTVCELVVGAALTAAALPACGAAGLGSLGVGAGPCAAGFFVGGIAVVGLVCHLEEVLDDTPGLNPPSGAGGAEPEPAAGSAGAGGGAGGGFGGGGGGDAGGLGCGGHGGAQ
jgi:RHS repeat-associated protein